MNNSKNIFEVVGIAAVVASLIFVGMEIRQSQEIAVASQYQSRIELNVSFYNAYDEQGFLATGEQFKQRVSESNLPGESKQEFLRMDSASLGRAAIKWRTVLFMFDNIHYQYRAGFMDDESWQASRRRLKNALAENSIMKFEIVGRPYQWRDSLRREFEQMLEELEKDK